jgi:hypothetical protein
VHSKLTPLFCTPLLPHPLNPQATVCISAIGSSSSSSNSRSRRSSNSRISIISTTIDGDALYAIKSNTIPTAAHDACEELDLYSLGFTAEELRLDMVLVEGSYLDNLYHNRHHGADVVSKSARTLQRDGKNLRRLVRKAQGLKTWGPDSERRYAVFELAVILAAAQHDLLHPGKDAAATYCYVHASAACCCVCCALLKLLETPCLRTTLNMAIISSCTALQYPPSLLLLSVRVQLTVPDMFRAMQASIMRT